MIYKTKCPICRMKSLIDYWGGIWCTKCQLMLLYPKNVEYDKWTENRKVEIKGV